MIGKRAVRLGVAAMLGCAALFGARSGPAVAGVVYHDSFKSAVEGRRIVGGVLPTPQNRGWHAVKPEGMNYAQPFQGVVVDLAKSGIRKGGGLRRGTLSLWVQRGEQTGMETVFSLADSHYAPLMHVMLGWPGWYEGRSEPELTVQSFEKYPLWYLPSPQPGTTTGISHDTIFPLEATIPRGRWFNLAFTWGPAASDNAIFLDGKKVRALPEDGIAFKDIVADATYLMVGAYAELDPAATATLPADPAAPLPLVHSPMGSTIAAVEIHDTVKYDFPPEYVTTDEISISELEHDAIRKAGFSGKLIAGNTLDVTLRGTAGAAATFDIAYFPDLDRAITLDWRGWGVYLEDKVFFEPAEVNLRDVSEYRVYAGTSPIDPANPAGEPIERLDVKVQTYTLADLTSDTPYYVAVVAAMRDGSLKTVFASPAALQLTETAPGVYTGTWQVTYQDRYPRAIVVGHLAGASASATLFDDVRSSIAVDPALTIAVATDPQELKADEKSVSTVSVTVTDANGNPVSGHKIKFLLATTSQYTGVVGGGAFTEQVGGTINESVWGQTDMFGKLTATYVAGFAAKTAVIVARDMLSNSTGAGYVKTFIQSAAELELLPVEPSAAADAGYTISVTSSDEWLTADGKSQARITAKVTLNNRPVEGHDVSFNVSAGSGTVRVVKGTTGKDGEARAIYTAGTKIGLVLITATDSTAGISGSVQIELRSDAPAKIAIKLDPEKIPADGRSTADLEVTVTDINDNPNDNTEVEYRIGSGGGRLKDDKGLTDRHGLSRNEYVAGRSPGKVSIEITVRSLVPTEEELAKSRALALAVTDYKFF